jgi:hypothetical protein
VVEKKLYRPGMLACLNFFSTEVKVKCSCEPKSIFRDWTGSKELSMLSELFSSHEYITLRFELEIIKLTIGFKVQIE